MIDSMGEKAEKEAQAQLDIIRILRKVPDRSRRQRIIRAVEHLIKADALVPGILGLAGTDIGPSPEAEVPAEEKE